MADHHSHTKRKTLAGKTEKRLLELNREKILRTALFLVLWIAADVLMWYLCSVWAERRMLSSMALPFLLLLIVPFWPMKKHEVFLGKTYYAEVTDIREKEEVNISNPNTLSRLSRNMEKTDRKAVNVYRVVWLRTQYGASEKLFFPSKDPIDFKVGDHVLKLSAFKYPVNCNFDEARDVYCMNCGQSNTPGRKRCVRCHFRLGREK